MKIRFDNIVKKYGQTMAVNNFSAELPDGQLICLLGPSGCGKSTLLNMLCGITPVTSGHIFFDDKDVTKLPPDQRDVGMVFQNYALYPHMTVEQNICFPLEVQKVPKKDRAFRAFHIAKLVHIENLLKRYPSELSGGQQQRVAIARALVKNPNLLLMDEPLSNLDARLRLEMREEIRRIQQETGVTTIFVTHDQEEAMSISDSIILMKNGELVQTGLCQQLYNNPKQKFVAEFLGNPPINKFMLLSSDVISKINFPSDVDFAIDRYILEIRPESFVLGGDFEAEVLSVSEIGKEQIVNLNFYGQEVRAIFNTDSDFTNGQKINVGLKNKGVFIFDEKTGERIS